MSTEALGTYLNDHLAGSVMAVEMVDRAIEDNPSTPLAEFLTGLVADIREDQDTLRRVLDRLEVAQSPLKKAGAWLAEKAGQLKLGHTGESALRRLEMLETLGLGIQGKLALWLALERVAAKHHRLAGFDFVALAHRARDQLTRVEVQRLEAATEAL